MPTPAAAIKAASDAANQAASDPASSTAAAPSSPVHPFPPSPAHPHPSPAPPHPSPAPPHPSPVTRHPSPVTRPPSPVTRPPSPVTGHPSAVPPLTTHHSPLTPHDLESQADALLMDEKRRARALVHALRADARRSGPSGAPLRRAADAIALDHAYYTEAQLRRRPIIGGRSVSPSSTEGPAAADIALPYSSCLRDLVSNGLEHLASRLGLTGRQAHVWTLHVRGDPLRTIAASLGVSYAAAYALLARAHRRVRASWLAAYRESLRRDAPPHRPR